MRDGQIRFFESFDGAKIAYCVSGEGPPVILLPSWLTHLEFQRRSVAWKPWLEALSSRYSLVRYDPRGCGMSDRRVDDLTFVAWVRDLDALVGHLKLDSFSLIGVCQGGAVALEYAARHPGRVSHLVLFGTYARGRNKRDDIPLEPEKARVMLDMVRLGWGSEDHAFATAFAQQFQPDGAPGHLATWCELQRRAASPEVAARLTEYMFRIDIRTALTVIGCPTLVAHATGDAVVPLAEGRLLAQSIHGAQFLELDTPNHFPRDDEPAWRSFVEVLHDFLPAPALDDARFGDLTAREREVLDLVAAGLDNRAIAGRLGISPKTVRNHVSGLIAALGVKSRAEAIVMARDAGFGRGDSVNRDRRPGHG
ncbi:alpha/beta fold hydrolase [Silicimonas algicola]|uniref:Alpha/beta hydrolase family protein n=1 Tax=Silicimonas algicola TaxID=1826607 RepID=A0A316G847_9RHOB|nr:alpha/beta fold hydrolase [Silicimonas algicola]PWK56782.1 alpha/beta hydrolase family protein [Silicimonas algicola]